MDVSVIIPALNAERTIARAVRSALSQTVQTLEVIVVDDGSTDRTAAIISDLINHDSRIRLIRHPWRQGVSSSRNDAIAVAAGEWIAVLDADDWYGPLRLERLLRHARENDLDGVIDNLTRVDAETQQVLGEAFPRYCMMTTQPIPASLPMELDIPYHHDGMGFGYCKPMFKRLSFFEKVGAYDQRFCCAEDLLVLQMFLLGGARVGTIETADYFYSVDRHSHSNKSGVYLDISAVNRIIVKEARRRGFFSMLPLLRDRQIVIDYDAFTKAVNQRRIKEAVTFLFRLPPKILLDQIIRLVGRRVGRDYSMLDPRNHDWLRPIARTE